MEVRVFCDQCHEELTESPRGADIYVDTDCSCRDASRKAAKDEGFDEGHSAGYDEGYADAERELQK